MGFGTLETLDQTNNAKLVTAPGWVLQPAMEFGVDPFWLFSLESDLRLVKYEAPSAASLVQDPPILGSLRGGVGFRSRVFELTLLGGVAQSPFISSAPTTTYITVQNILMPHIGARLAYNGRWSKTFYFRAEAEYLNDFRVQNDRGTLQVLKNSRIFFNTHWGEFNFSQWARLTVGFGLQMSETSLGRQSGMTIQVGLSLGSVFGQKVPTTR